MPKPSASLKAALEPYQTALDSMKDLDVSMSNLRDKKSLLEKEMLSIDDRLATLDRERPECLEAVLSGSRPERDLVDRQAEADRLKAERTAKQDLLTLVETQIQAKAQSRVNLNARLEPLRRRIFAAIEQDILAQLPPDFLPYLTRLSAVSSMNGRSGVSVLQGLMPERKHDDWEKELSRILEGYGIPSH